MRASHNRHHSRSAAAGIAAAFALILLIASPGAGSARGWSAPAYQRTIGGPGHAGVYAWGAATAPDGSILIGDYWNYVVRRYSADGTLTQTLSGRGKGPGQNSAPHGVATDPVDGSVYLADMNHPERRIVKLAPDGTWIRDIATMIPGVTVPYPYVTHIATGPTGEVYAVSSHNVPYLFATVLVFSKDGVFTRAITGDPDGPGKLGLIHGIAVDSDSSVYLADATKGVVQVFDANGRFVRSIGARGKGPGKFTGDMRGVAIDRARGVIYVADSAASQIEKFSRSGTPLATFGSEGTGPGQFRDGGRELTVGLDGNVYAPDFGNNRVLVFSPTGRFLRAFPEPSPAPAGGFNQAMGLAVAPGSGAVYVADTYNHRIQQFGAKGDFVRQWGHRGSTGGMALNYPRGVAVDPGTARVWVSNSRQGNIKTYTPTGTFVASFGQWGTGAGQYQLARDLVVTGDRVYIADSNNLRIVATDRRGSVLWTQPCGVTFLPGNGPGLLKGCTGVGVDRQGRVYAAAVTENALYVFSPAGTLLRKLTTGLKAPYDVAVHQDRVYVSEFTGHRVAVLTTGMTRLGSFGSAGSGHGQFRNPAGLDVDAQGRLYVMDALNERVEVFG